MANEKTRKRIDDSLTFVQKIKSGFAGDASAQEKARAEYLRQNELSNQNATSEAIKKRLER